MFRQGQAQRNSLSFLKKEKPGSPQQPKSRQDSASSYSKPRDSQFSEGISKEELAADGIVLDIEYNSDRNEFAYCSADKLAYIRKFSPNGSEMNLQVILQGHESEVTQVKTEEEAGDEGGRGGWVLVFNSWLLTLNR